MNHWKAACQVGRPGLGAGRQVGRSEFAEIRWEAFAVGRAQARLSPKLAEPTANLRQFRSVGLGQGRPRPG